MSNAPRSAVSAWSMCDLGSPAEGRTGVFVDRGVERKTFFPLLLVRIACQNARRRLPRNDSWRGLSQECALPQGQKGVPRGRSPRGQFLGPDLSKVAGQLWRPHTAYGRAARWLPFQTLLGRRSRNFSARSPSVAKAGAGAPKRAASACAHRGRGGSGNEFRKGKECSHAQNAYRVRGCCCKGRQDCLSVLRGTAPFCGVCVARRSSLGARGTHLPVQPIGRPLRWDAGLGRTSHGHGVVCVGYLPVTIQRRVLALCSGCARPLSQGLPLGHVFYGLTSRGFAFLHFGVRCYLVARCQLWPLRRGSPSSELNLTAERLLARQCCPAERITSLIGFCSFCGPRAA